MVYYLLTGIFIDLIIGDPKLIPHPVVIIGKLISIIETTLRRITKSKRGERISGIILVLLVVGFTYISTFYLIRLGYMINYYVGLALNLWLIATTIAIKGLARAGFKIYNYLSAGDIESAREAVGQIVGRDTQDLDEKEIIRATVETIAENTSDGIIAPVFFFLLGGTPLTMAYKAVNTLDSMVGYQDERYKFFGWAAARFDDLVNYIPARLTGIGFCLVALLIGNNGKKAWKIMRRDARKHPSPNAGYPEGAIAGALGVRLGGLNYYSGQPSFRAYLGDKMKELERRDIKVVIRMMYWNVGLIVSLALLVIKVATL